MRLQVEPNTILAWESGTSRPPLSKLEALSEAYRRPLAVFLLPHPPKEPPQLADFRSTNGPNGPGAFSEETVLAIRRARRSQALALRLAHELDTHPDAHLPRVSDTEDPEEVAKRVAGFLGAYANNDPPRLGGEYQALNHWRQLLEGVNILVLQFPMPISDARGFSLPGSRFPVVVLNQRDPPRPRIFTLFHELGHLLLRSDGVCDLTEGSVSPSDGSIERFCNHFAGAFLVPKGTLVAATPWLQPATEPDRDDIQNLTSRFNVSEEVVLRRMLICGLIGQKEHDRLVSFRRSARRSAKARESTAKIKRNLPIERRSQYGSRFVSMVIDGHRAERLSLSEVSSALDLRIRHFQSLSKLLAEGPTGV